MMADRKLTLQTAADGGIIAIESFPFEIGRDSSCELWIGNDPDVSLLHARITRDAAGDCRFHDLEPANGTFVNDERIATGEPIMLPRTMRSSLAPQSSQLASPMRRPLQAVTVLRSGGSELRQRPSQIQSAPDWIRTSDLRFRSSHRSRCSGVLVSSSQTYPGPGNRLSPAS